MSSIASAILPYERSPSEITVEQSDDLFRVVIPMTPARRRQLLISYARAGFYWGLLMNAPQWLGRIIYDLYHPALLPKWVSLVLMGVAAPFALVLLFTPLLWILSQMASSTILEIDAN